MFKTFQQDMQSHFQKMCKHQLYVVDVDKDVIWDTYLNSFPDGSNPVYKERTEHDCTCCRQFVKNYGGIVAIINNQIVSIWDFETKYPYDRVSEKMSKFVKSHTIKDVFLTDIPNMGTNVSLQQDGTSVITWNHFYCKAPNEYVTNNIPTKLGAIRTSKQMLERAMDELTIAGAETLLEIIDQGILYRGQEFKTGIQEFVKLKKAYDKAEDKQIWLWSNCNNNFTRIRNTAIGTLLVDICEDVDIDVAMKKFESIMAPTNYKRPKSVITKKMVKDAEIKVNELGLSDSLGRRYANINDITINNVLFVNRSTKTKISSSPFDDLSTVSKPRKMDRVQEISINDFIQNVLPTTNTIRVMFEGRHRSNLMSLIAPEHKDAPPLFKWDNNFSWAYNGDITDSMREAVQAAGGRVDGVFRFTHSWNHDGHNQSLMDLHVFIPGHNGHQDGCHDLYGNEIRVGWNHRSHNKTKGVQDVDFTSPPGNSVPVENITFPDIKYMPEGEYVCKIHNWRRRTPCTSGFKAQIEFDGQIFNYDHPKPLKNKEWVTVAVVTLKNGQFSIDHKLPHDTENINIWGVNTGDFVEVNSMMFSPNYWDNKQIGNQHYFFIMNGCKNDGQPRGFFNEFLKEELTPHRKVFEALGAKMKVPEDDNQLSGLGFSSSQRNDLVVEVTGNTKRVMKVLF